MPTATQLDLGFDCALSDHPLLRAYETVGKATAMPLARRLQPDAIRKRLRKLEPDYVSLRRRRNPRFLDLMMRFIEGESVLKISRAEGIPYSSLQRAFVRIHPDYSRLAQQGVFNSCTAAIRRYQRRQPQKATECREWLRANLIEIFDSESQSRHAVQSAKAEARHTRRETSFLTDFRDESIDASAYARAWAGQGYISSGTEYRRNGDYYH